MRLAQGMFEIESRLASWAYYRINLNQGAIGWPSRNLLVNMAQSTGARYPTTGVCLILKFDNSQQTDTWIRSMGKVYPHLEEALTFYYTCKLPIKQLAKALGVSRSAFMQRVHEAKIWLAGRLNAYIEAQSTRDQVLK